eukprot:SAG31_NODE_802_length_12008_cov_18.741036_7_plen_178_part_00
MKSKLNEPFSLPKVAIAVGGGISIPSGDLDTRMRWDCLFRSTDNLSKSVIDLNNIMSVSVELLNFCCGLSYHKSILNMTVFCSSPKYFLHGLLTSIKSESDLVFCKRSIYDNFDVESFLGNGVASASTKGSLTFSANRSLSARSTLTFANSGIAVSKSVFCLLDTCPAACTFKPLDC